MFSLVFSGIAFCQVLLSYHPIEKLILKAKSITNRVLTVP